MDHNLKPATNKRLQIHILPFDHHVSLTQKDHPLDPHKTGAVTIVFKQVPGFMSIWKYIWTGWWFFAGFQPGKWELLVSTRKWHLCKGICTNDFSQQICGFQPCLYGDTFAPTSNTAKRLGHPRSSQGMISLVWITLLPLLSTIPWDEVAKAYVHPQFQVTCLASNSTQNREVLDAIYRLKTID